MKKKQNEPTILTLFFGCAKRLDCNIIPLALSETQKENDKTYDWAVEDRVTQMNAVEISRK